jgi:predicted nucleic acid-binding protein
MKKLFFDTNIVLDLSLENRTGHRVADEILQQSEDGGIACSWHTLSILEYVGGKVKKDHIFDILETAVEMFDIPETGKKHAKEAFHFLNGDYEDAMQIVSAMAVDADYIITNDKQGGFNKSPIPIMTATEYLAMEL